MMASAAGQFAHPGGMPGHGMPHGAHPGMGPGGHPGGPGGPGGVPGAATQQMHAMSGGPQPGQGGPMMGMPQSGGQAPNAHALSHLNPAANAQIYQQQQMQAALAQNPQLLQQQIQAQQQVRQRQMMMQAQQQQQAHHAQQQQGGGMMMNRPGMGGMQGGVQAVPLPPHMQAQIQSQQAQQQFLQQQQQAMAQQQQQHQMALVMQQQQQQQQQHQQQQQQQQQHQQAQQQAQHQQQQQPQSAGPQGPNAGQPGQPQQMRPPSQMQNHQQEHQAQAAAQQQAQQQQAQQTPQPAQQGQPGQQPPQQQQGQAQAAMAQQGGPQQPPPQGMPGQPGQQGQPQGEMSQQQLQQRMAIQARMTAQQQAAMTSAMAQQQMNTASMRGSSVLKLLNFADHLSSFSLRQETPPQNDIEHWKQFVSRFFSVHGVLRQTLVHSSDSGGKTFELKTGALPRYYWSHFQHGVQQIQMMMENAHEKDLPNGGHFVECLKASFIYWYKDGHQVMSVGPLKAQFNNQGKIDVLEHLTNEHREYVAQTQLQPSPTSPEQTKSPTMSKKNKNKQPVVKQENLVVAPKSAVGEWGVTPPMLQFIELAETFSHMENLFNFYNKNDTLTPPEALRQLVMQWTNQAATQQNAGIPTSADGTPTSTLNPAFAGNPAAVAAHRHAMSQASAGFNPQMAAMGVGGPGGPNFPGGAAHLGMGGPGAANIASPAPMGMSPAGLPGQPGGPNQMGGVGTPGGPPPQAAGVAMVAQASQQGSAGGSAGASANTSPHVANKKRRASQVKMEGDGDAEGVNGVKVKASPRVGGKRQKP